jgi:hypothetical protein
MRLYNDESREGLYEVFYSETGERIIVLEGLSVNDTFSPSPLQNWFHSHYSGFGFFYWILLVSVFIYMAGVHLVIPVMRRFGLY